MNSRLPGQVLMQHGGGALQVVGGAGQDRIRTEQGPVGERARRPVRQAEAPGVDDAAAVGEAVERHMRVAADDIRSSTPTNASANHANGLLTSTISSSWRAVAWQNRTGPSPSTSTLTVRGSAARARWSRCARINCRPAQMCRAHARHRSLIDAVEHLDHVALAFAPHPDGALAKSLRQ